MAAESTVEVASALWAVDSAFEATDAPYLLYWRALLSNCLGQQERYVSDLQLFVDTVEETDEYASMANDARRRLRSRDRWGDLLQVPARNEERKIELWAGGGFTVGVTLHRSMEVAVHYLGESGETKTDHRSVRFARPQRPVPTFAVGGQLWVHPKLGLGLHFALYQIKVEEETLVFSFDDDGQTLNPDDQSPLEYDAVRLVVSPRVEFRPFSKRPLTPAIHLYFPTLDFGMISNTICSDGQTGCIQTGPLPALFTFQVGASIRMQFLPRLFIRVSLDFQPLFYTDAGTDFHFQTTDGNYESDHHQSQYEYIENYLNDRLGRAPPFLMHLRFEIGPLLEGMKKKPPGSRR